MMSNELTGVTAARSSFIGPPKPTRIQKLKSFASGFLLGITSPVSAWASLKKIEIGLSCEKVKSALHEIKGGSLREFGINLGYLSVSSLSLYFAVRCGAYFPEIKDYLASLANRPWAFWMKNEILQSTTSADVFRTFSESDILNRAIPFGQYLNYFTPYLIAPPAGAINEIVREAGQKEPISPWKTAYVAFRFLVGTVLLVKLGELTWGMSYLKALGYELSAWSIYYGAFTIPTAFARGKTPEQIDQILRKQVFYTAILTSLGLATLTTLVNPLLLSFFGSWGKPEKLGHLIPVLTRGIWEIFITQMVLRAEFGGDEFVSRIFNKLIGKKE